MKNRLICNREGGFSLLEMIAGVGVAMTIVLVLFFFVFQQLNSYRSSKMAANARENVRNGMNLIVHDLEMAGYGIGQKHAIRYFADPKNIYAFKQFKSDWDDDPLSATYSPHDSLALVRASGTPHSIVYYDNTGGSSTLCLCGNATKDFLKKSTGAFQDASLYDEAHSDFISIAISAVTETSMGICSSTKLSMSCSSSSGSSWTLVRFSIKPTTGPKQEELGMQKSTTSHQSNYYGGTLYPNLKVIAYAVLTEDLAPVAWSNRSGRSILWRDDGSGPQAVAEDVESFQIDFEDTDNLGRSIKKDCALGSSYVLPGFDPKICGIKSEHAIVTLVTRSSSRESGGLSPAIIRLPVELKTPLGADFEPRCFPSCTKSDEIRRQAFVKQVLLRNLL